MNDYENENNSENEFQKEDENLSEYTNQTEVNYETSSNVETNYEFSQPQDEPIENESEIPKAVEGEIEDVTPPYSHPYTETVRNKPKKRSKGIIAAVLVLTVLNFAIFAGAYFLGRQNGLEARHTNSKSELISQMNGSKEKSDGFIQTATNQNELLTTEIAKTVGPSVVGITSTIQGQMSIFGTMSSGQAEGSGIIMSDDGYIVTNNHVVEGASEVTVLLNTGTEYKAKIIGADKQTDLAVIKIEPNEEIVAATFGDSNTLEVGERVVAIGNPMGLEFFGTVTQGIVSAVNRTVTMENRSFNLIQTDAAINSGNSGGALINRFGEVIGINSIKLASSGVEGMCFAIPISEAKPVIADLLEYGYVKGRPVIGISTRDVNEYLANTYSWPQGVQVMEITSENAKSAGLQQGDIITEVDGESIKDTESLNKIKNAHAPGDTLTFKVFKYATGGYEDIRIVLSEQIPG